MHRAILALTLLIACTAQVDAEVYKCREKGGIVYADIPCSSDGGGAQMDIRTPPAAPPSAASPYSRQLDTAVRKAIAEGDLARAESLAAAPQHWEWIAATKKERQAQPVLGRTEADLSAEKGDSSACQQAKRDYEVATSAYKQVDSAIEAKRSFMHAACGIKEPTQIKIDNSTTIIDRSNRAR